MRTLPVIRQGAMTEELKKNSARGVELFCSSADSSACAGDLVAIEAVSFRQSLTRLAISNNGY